MAQFKWQLIFLAFLFNQQNVEAQCTATERNKNQRHAVPKQFPYQVYFKIPTVFDEKLVCGGVIISNRTILTAANCIPKNFDFIRIYFGTVDALNNMETGQQRLQVNKKYIVVHPEWDPKQDINDIALIKLPADLQFDDYIKPAQLPDPNQSYENESAVVSVYASSTGQLMYSNETVLSNEKCRCTLQRYRPGVFFPSSWICLKPADCGPCKGDSGGPLAIRHEDGSSTLLGLIKSVKDGQCTTNVPFTFTRVSSYLEWIEQNV